MATYGAAVDLILTELARSDTSITAVVEREFQKAIDFYQFDRFWFNEARISFTASNTIYYPMSSFSAALLEIDQVTVTVSGSVIELMPQQHSKLQRMDVSGFTGYPTHWALFAEQIRLYPKAPSGSVYQVDVLGTKKLATLSASTDANAWSTEALNLMSSRVQKHIWSLRFKDVDKAAYHGQIEIEEYGRLMARTERLISSGKISPGY